MRRGLVVALPLCIVGVLAFGGEDAFAECALPGAFAAPSKGKVPPNPTIIIFNPNRTLRYVKSGDGVKAVESTDPVPRVFVHNHKGRRSQVAAEIVSHHEDIQVLAVKVEARTGRFSLEIPNWMFGPFVIDPKWKRPERSVIQLSDPGNTDTAWTCSFERTRDFVPEIRAPAYKLVWSPSIADYRAGKTEQVYLPATKACFWRFNEDGDHRRCEDEPAKIQLGHLNCVGANFRWGAEPVFVGMAAVYPDGSVDPLQTEPTKVDPPSNEFKFNR